MAAAVKESMEDVIKSIRPHVYDWSFDVFDVARRTGGRPLYAVTMALFEEEGLLDGWLLDRAAVAAYLCACETTYRANNPYHNNSHAADVTQTAACLLRAFCAAAGRPVPPLERFCVLLASAVHDLGHPGVNNDFLVRTRHRLAGLYNDRSVNEHFHCATAFDLAHSVRPEAAEGGAAASAAAGDGRAQAAAAENGTHGGGGGGGGGGEPWRPLTDLIGALPTLQRSGADDGQGGPAALLPARGKAVGRERGGQQHQQQQAGGGAAAAAAAAAADADGAPSPPPAVIGDGGIFSRFPLPEYVRARALIVGMVLSTDMGLHFDLLGSFRAAGEREGGRPPGAWADRSLAFQLLVHLADLANPSRPFPLALRWAESVVAEFLAQGDAEAASGVAVSAMCDRGRVSMPRAQLNFVAVFMRPTLDALAPAVPAFAAASRPCLDDTVAKWEWLERQGVRLPLADHAYPELPPELRASRPWEAAAAEAAAAAAQEVGGEPAAATAAAEAACPAAAAAAALPPPDAVAIAKAAEGAGAGGARAPAPAKTGA